MTTSKSEPLQVTLSEEARKALADGATTVASPAAAEARDRLLRSIGREAEHLADTQPGQASKALAELAHAYSLVTAPVLTAGLVGDAEGTDAASSPRLVIWVTGDAQLFPLGLVRPIMSEAG
ncbi:hypothetical protein ACF1BA_27745 [Streptomyces rubiginosohelvolus]|uniref:hypothetical protein n=1 Tax=Streptomyces rubiginosohelvolus TaxID=67362 RepID=UPI0036F6B231